ncbi:MAG: methyltransferase domain-containing protein, partial [Flavipsychrobacter sp.]
QIWIATHSVPLLAHFDPSCIWYVENNKVSYAGKIPEKVLHSLLGDENEIARLQDFISLPSQFATSQYAFESLFEPIAVVTKADDPQSLQIRENLLRISKNGKLKILDYGAGKGRVLANLLELDIKNQEKIIESLDYIAFDKYANDKEICQGIIDNVYSGKERRYFNDINELLSVEDKGSFDIVLMCNVLHEIDPKDWLKLFAKDGEVSSLLNENGILLLVEDQQIPIGEKAYQKGFLVLDTAQLKDLFKITKDDGDFVFNDKRGDGRLKAHHIPKRLLERIDKDSREAAIKSLSNLAKQRIIEIRSQQLTYKNGKLHGFWTQQFANAQLNLAELTIT